MEPLLRGSIVEHDVEAAGHRDDDLVQGLVPVSPSHRAARHVVRVVHAFDREGNMAVILDEREIAAGVGDLGELDQMTVVEGHTYVRDSVRTRPSHWNTLPHAAQSTSGAEGSRRSPHAHT